MSGPVGRYRDRVTKRQGILARVVSFFSPARPTAPRTTAATPDTPGRVGSTATIEIAPPGPAGLKITYGPKTDADPDAGEIVWTWVPYTENDGRGKDRPVLVIGRQDAQRVYAVRLTSKPHEGDHDFLALGTGAWDSRGRPSWVDIEQLYSVHAAGMRREASALDLKRFVKIADALHRRYGWAVGN